MKFRFVDQVTAWEPFRSIQGCKSVSFEEYSLKDQFGEPPGLPATLVLESFLQLGNWLILLSTDFKQMGMVIRLHNIRFDGILRPGQRLDMGVVMTNRREDGYELAGEGWANGQKLVTGLGCLARPVRTADYANPEDLRTLYSEISPGL